MRLGLRRRYPVRLLIPVGIALIASQALIAGQLPAGHDALLHLYRLVQLADLFANGILFSRWAPALGLGYGAPLFNYYAPLLYYLSLPFQFIGAEPGQALGLTLMSAALVGAIGTYAWLRDWLGWRAGAIASMAYLSAPYLSFTVLHRGAFAEGLALSIAPLAFFLLHRWATTNQSWAGTAFAACHALLVLSHNINALLFTALLAVYPLIISVPQRRLTLLLRSWLLIGLGLGLTAFFWLPALGERHLVRIERVFLLEIFDYRRNFVALSELLALPRPVESGLAIQPVTRSISLVALGLAAIGAIGLWTHTFSPSERRFALGALAASLTFLTLMLEASRPVWEAMSFIQFVQTPWRLLGITSLTVAVLAAAGFAYVERRLSSATVRGALLSASLSALALYGFAWQFPSYLPKGLRPRADAIADFERQRGLVTLSAGEYLPTTVEALPPENASSPIDLATLPSHVTLHHLACRPLVCEVKLTATQPATLTFNIFNFAGWQATSDDQPVPIVTQPPHGLIGVPIPAADHTLRLVFASTPLRDLASGISVASLCALAISVVILRVKRSATQQASQGDQAVTPEKHELLAVLATLAALLAAKFALAHIDTPLRYTRFNGQRLTHADLAMDVNFGERLMLMGIDAPSSAESAGTWECVLYWRRIQPTDENYHTAVQVVDSSGDIVGQSNAEYPGGMPSSWWPSGTYARDVHRVLIQPGTPPGQYQVQIVVYEAGKPYQRLPIVSATLSNGWTAGDTAIRVTQLAIKPPQHPVQASAVQPAVTLRSTSVGGLRLIGHDRLPEQLYPGDAFRYALYWRADDAISPALPIEVRLRQGEDVALRQQVEPVPSYPRNQWRVGDIWRANHTLRLPPAIQGGDWQIDIVIDATVIPLAGRIRVPSLARSFTPPAASVSQTVTFANVARLVGYDAPDLFTPGQPFSVTLYWQALSESTERYKAFVHLLDAQGERRAGSDSPPAGGQRPTTSWVSGEYITDTHTIHPPQDLAPGTYRLLVGLYEEWRITRLTTTEGQDAVVLSKHLRIGHD
jgi:hypothetical protein